MPQLLLRPRVRGFDTDRVLVSAEREALVEKITKWIPIEVIGAYQVVCGFITEEVSAVLGVSIAFAALTFGWIAFATKGPTERIAWRQTVLSTVAFSLWAVGTQPSLVRGVSPDGPPWIGPVALGVGSLALPILDGILKRLGMTQD
jgi:hypothetical protein